MESSKSHHDSKVISQALAFEVETNIDQKESTKIPVFNTIVMIALSSTEGFNLGYMESLMGIFRQRGFHSSKIGILSIMMYPFLLSFLGAPVVDKYYSRKFGKRKSYLVPCKMAIAIGLFILSYFIDEFVDDGRVTTIALYLFLIGLIQLFDFNALTGLRYEIYGHENTGLASFTLYAGSLLLMVGMLLGTFFAYHMFILLNSEYVCRDLLGIESGPILSHGSACAFFAFVNLASGIGVYFIKEKVERPGDRNKLVSIVKLLKIFLFDPTYRRVTFWLTFSCFGAIGLRSSVSLQLIKKGLRREHIVMLLATNAIFNMTNNFILKKYMVPGRIIRVCCFFILAYLCVLYIDLYNVVTFDPELNYNRTLVLYFVGIFFESACPWMSYHMGFINATTYHKYAASYQTTLMGIVNIGKIIPVTSVVTLMDYTNYTFLFFVMNSINMLFIVLTFNSLATKIDLTTIETYNKIIETVETKKEEESLKSPRISPKDSVKIEKKF